MRRRDEQRTPRRLRQAEDPGTLDLPSRYREAVHRYEELVRRCCEDFADRSGTVTLALAALRASRTGIALLGARGFVTRNARWLELAHRDGPWKPLDPADGGSHASIEAAAAALARPLLADMPSRTRVTRFARGDAEQVVELRLEAVIAGRRALVYALADDVTERVLAEREMARARDTTMHDERMRLVGELASSVAHDLNNTLHALSLRLGHLQASDLDAAQLQDVQTLSRIVGDAAERVSRLQELARKREDVPTESFDLRSVVREALAVARPDIEEHAHAAGVRFEIEEDLPGDVRLVGSPAELRHVFVNLLLNARDAMPQGGRIRIQGRAAGSWAEVKVEDEGVGIASEHLDRLFDPFFTTKGHLSMGLGLAIAQGVMRRLGGHISVASHPGAGAAFTLTFPICRESPAPSPAPPRRASPRHHLLVVDDDEDNLEAIRWVLQDLGQDVDVAASGDEAIALVSSGRRYDLILCDVGMPNMNGWQVAEQVRRLAPDARFLLLTGWAQEISPGDPKRRLVDGILAKPLDLPRLRGVLDERPGPPVADRH